MVVMQLDIWLSYEAKLPSCTASWLTATQLYSQQADSYPVVQPAGRQLPSSTASWLTATQFYSQQADSYQLYNQQVDSYPAVQPAS